MNRIRWNEVPLWLSSLALAGLVGCGGASDSLPRQAVSGSVTLDGKPLEAGSITFDPVDEGKAGAVNAGALISGGSYSIPRDKGLTPGAYRVSVVAASGKKNAPTSEAPGAPPRKKAGKATIPAKYNSRSTLQAEVKADASPSFNFDLKSS